MTDTTTWRELFPEGRVIFYEGDDPAAFTAAIKAEFGFDPAADPRWGRGIKWGEGPMADGGEAGSTPTSSTVRPSTWTRSTATGSRWGADHHDQHHDRDRSRPA